MLFFSYKDLKDKLNSFSHLANLGGTKYLDQYANRNIKHFSIEFLDQYINSSTPENVSTRAELGELWLNHPEIDPPITSSQTVRTHKLFRN